MIRPLLISALCALPLSAIVMIAPVDPGQKHGFGGEVVFAVKESSGNTERRDYEAGAQLQYDYNRNSDYLIADYQYGISKRETIADSSFLHLRHLYLWRERAVWELFAQAERDHFMQLTLRVLAGAGYRHRIINSQNGKLYLGVGGYHSNEHYARLGENRVESRGRANVYISFKHDGEQKISSALTLYYQPAFEVMEDYYLVAQGSIKLFVTQKLSVKLFGSLKEDSAPLTGNRATDSLFSTAFSYEF